jgi:hypothetical protein
MTDSDTPRLGVSRSIDGSARLEAAAGELPLVRMEHGEATGTDLADAAGMRERGVEQRTHQHAARAVHRRARR